MRGTRMATIGFPALLVLSWLVVAPAAASAQAVTSDFGWLVTAPPPAFAQAVTTDHVPGLVEWGFVEFKTPTQVFDQILWGKYIVVHDKVREARGEPCTTFHKIDENRLGRLGEIAAAFHCELVEGVASTPRLAAYAAYGPSEGLMRMTRYQFAGRTEEHRVPVDPRRARGH